MLLRQLFEDNVKIAVIGWGRMNPPTIGHSVLVNAINEKAKQYGGDPMLFLTMSHLAKGATKSYLTPKGKTNKHFRTAGIKNPLDWKTKLGYAQSFYKIPISTDPSLNTIMSVMKHLETKGYEKVVLVAGSDRVREFETQILPYNNTADQSGNVNFNIKEVSVEEGGFRDEEANDASGMSASKMREAAAQDDFESFKQGVPNQKLAKQMFDDVREGLGFNHQTEDSDLDEYKLFKSTDNASVKEQDPNKLKVLDWIADRVDGKEHFLSFYRKGAAWSGRLLFIKPEAANKFRQKVENNQDHLDRIKKMLTSIETTSKLLTQLDIKHDIRRAD
jgi:hypothetical protein